MLIGFMLRMQICYAYFFCLYAKRIIILSKDMLIGFMLRMQFFDIPCVLFKS